MWKKFSLRGNYKWLDILPDLLTAYNNRKRTSGAKPKDVTANNEADILKKFASKITKKIKPKFKIGDKVRVSKAKVEFTKDILPIGLQRYLQSYVYSYKSSDLPSEGLSRSPRLRRLLRARTTQSQVSRYVSCRKSN